MRTKAKPKRLESDGITISRRRAERSLKRKEDCSG